AVNPTPAPRIARVDDFQSIIVNHKAVPELNRGRARVIEADAPNNLWIEGIVKANDHQLTISRNVSVSSRDGNIVRSRQDSFGIECAVWVLRRIKLPLQIIIQRIAVQQRRCVYDNQSFELIDHVEISVQWMNRLLFIHQLVRR